jgi:hypothetical protein
VKPNDSLRARREQAEKDAELLEAAMENEKTTDRQRVIFEGWVSGLARGNPLSEKQRAWAVAASKGERYEPEEEYLNLASTGNLARGKPVELLVD